MKAYHFRKIVGEDGSIVLSNLPPHQEVEIIVLQQVSSESAGEIKQWLADIRQRHPFAKMSKAEILKVLRETRDKVWAERSAG
jgi:hypothetical protein